jgi:hypothetical protein
MSAAASSLWRPPQWQKQSPAKVIITFPGQGSAPQYNSSASGSGTSLPSEQTLYAFDAEIHVEHQQQLRKTEHPVQTGASISDHAYIVPARLVLDVGMSDAMDAYFDPSTWSGSPSKSISAYQTMVALQFSRVPLSITTRLRTYKNMVIESLMPVETHKTLAGLRMRVEFGQIFMAVTSSIPASARNKDTQETNLGAVNPEPPSSSQETQNKVTKGANPPTPPSNAAGAGIWASDNWNSQQSWYSQFGGK